jgi:hypothetical protein
MKEDKTMGKKSRRQGSRNKNRQNQAARQPGRKLLAPVVITLVIAAVVGYFLFGGKAGPERVPDVSQTDIQSLRGGETKASLSPSLFVGRTAAAYRVARENPELLDTMYCYCYCSRSIGHKSLLSCFVDNHAANCGICQDQAFYAYSLDKKGYDLAQVRQAVDKKFWRPFM